ncbi:LacI family DNA-binding transcriptional regulator [Bacillus sp. FJAT-50079]|uniref:LacI family DNA-binding transcriptional regulator n=1 Tax=Bacillus sp. FJAT-50079 TaxID=2833577 RepID=UPI001BC991A7|nr:LacI family DNA-binding transcriptional regulator [Bacillus sp. FJAT-50079]MBS4206610.1 LacI family DNA-binding transcriptional regulator [Bacillus sp. FJAT-50079]
MKDVAKAAGVSLGTVSKVVNRSGYVSPEIKERVLLAISLLNYKPNGIARSLKNAKTNLIGVVLPNLEDIYLLRILKSIESITARMGYKIIYCSTNNEISREIKLLQWLIEKRVDGILLYPSSEELTDVEIPSSIPIVLLERSLKQYQITTVMHENVDICRKLIEPLVFKGNQNFIFLHGPQSDSIELSRIKGFKKTIEHFGLNKANQIFVEIDIRNGCNDLASYIKEQLHRAEMAECIIASNPVLLAEAVKILSKWDKNMEVSGFGEVDPYGLLSPKLRTAIEQPDELVSVALDVLFDKIIDQTKITSKYFYITLKINE